MCPTVLTVNTSSSQLLSVATRAASSGVGYLENKKSVTWHKTSSWHLDVKIPSSIYLWLPPRVPAEAQQELAGQTLRRVCGSPPPSSRGSPADPGFSGLVWLFSLTAEALLRTSRARFFESTTPTPAHLVLHTLAAGPATPLGAGYPRTSGRVAWGQKDRWWTGPTALTTVSHRAQGITISPSPQGGPAPRVLAWLWAPAHLLLCIQGLSLLFCVLMQTGLSCERTI